MVSSVQGDRPTLAEAAQGLEHPVDFSLLVICLIRLGRFCDSHLVSVERFGYDLFLLAEPPIWWLILSLLVLSLHWVQSMYKFINSIFNCEWWLSDFIEFGHFYGGDIWIAASQLFVKP
jgi:hypothetical protein